MLVYLALHLLPALSPEPRLGRRDELLRVEDDRAVFQDLDLEDGAVIDVGSAPNLSRQRDLSLIAHRRQRQDSSFSRFPTFLESETPGILRIGREAVKAKPPREGLSVRCVLDRPSKREFLQKALSKKSPALAGLSSIGAPRFELGTSSPPD